MIDHGYVAASIVTTGYNHAIRYTVRVGQRVRKGQVIGYVGSTGYSTGCHLHFMVWLERSVAKPDDAGSDSRLVARYVAPMATGRR